MGQVTTHTEGRVVVTSTDDSVEVVQLPARDGVQGLAAGEVVDDGRPPARTGSTPVDARPRPKPAKAAKAKARKK